MPKTKVARRPPIDDHLPIWDALVAELPDPRPHEPLFIEPAYTVPDDLFLDETISYDTACAQLCRDAQETFEALGVVGHEAVAALDAIYPWPDVAEPVDASSALASLDVESTQVLPVWPTTTDEPRGDES